MPELREAVLDRDRRTGNNSELPPMPRVAYTESWLHTYLLLGLEADFPVSEAILHSMTYGQDFEGHAHRTMWQNEAGGCQPIVKWHGYDKCKNPTHRWHTIFGEGCTEDALEVLNEIMGHAE